MHYSKFGDFSISEVFLGYDLISLLFIAEALGKLFGRGIRKTQDKRN